MLRTSQRSKRKKKKKSSPSDALGFKRPPKKQTKALQPPKRARDLFPDKPKDASFLDLYRLEALQKFGHPDKVVIELIEKNYAMMLLIEEEMKKSMGIEIENGKIIKIDTEGEFFFDSNLAELFRRFSAEVRAAIKDIRKEWDSLSDKKVDEYLVKAYQNSTMFYEFLGQEDDELIPKFVKWRSAKSGNGNGHTIKI